MEACPLYFMLTCCLGCKAVDAFNTLVKVRESTLHIGGSMVPLFDLVIFNLAMRW